MATAINNKTLVDRAMRFITSDVNDQTLRLLVQEAIRAADEELRNIDEFSPLAWHIGTWDNLRTVLPAEISAITAADPGVITAASINSTIEAHGFRDNSSNHQDIVLIDGISSGGDRDQSLGMEMLNNRFYLLDYVDADTFSLDTIDGLNDVDTSDMYAYDSGGTVYHAGFKIDPDLIEADVASQWSFGEIIPYGVTIDGFPCHPVGQFDISNKYTLRKTGFAQRPKHYFYWQHHETVAAASPTIGHYLFLLPVSNQEYNVKIDFRKEIPEMSTWNTTAYPPHPIAVHSALWKGALAKLVGDAKKLERSSERAIATQVEVLFAQRWQEEWSIAKFNALNLHRKLLGESGGMGGITA